MCVCVCDQPKMVTILEKEQNIETIAIKNVFIKKCSFFVSVKYKAQKLSLCLLVLKLVFFCVFCYLLNGALNSLISRAN